MKCTWMDGQTLSRASHVVRSFFSLREDIVSRDVGFLFSRTKQKNCSFSLGAMSSCEPGVAGKEASSLFIIIIIDYYLCWLIKKAGHL